MKVAAGPHPGKGPKDMEAVERDLKGRVLSRRKPFLYHSRHSMTVFKVFDTERLSLHR